MLRRLPVLLLPFAVLCPSISHGGPDEPSNYDECIVDAMKGVSSDVAARAIIESCRNLFPKSPAQPLPPAAPEPTAPGPAAAEVATTATTAAPAVQAAPQAEAAPLDTTGARDLTDAELDRLRVKAKVFGSTYRITVDNGNPHLTLTEMTIAVWDDSDPATGRKEYSEAVQIGPQATTEVKFTVHYRGDESSWRWGVVGARGVE